MITDHPNYNPQKIIIIENSLDTTGAFNAILSNCTDLRDDFIFIFIIPDKSKNDQILKKEGFEYYKYNLIEISKRPGSILLYLPFLILNGLKLAGKLRKESISIVHVNDIYNLTAVVAKLFAKFKLVTHIRRMPESFPSPIYKLWVKMHLKFSDSVLPVSEANKEIFGDHHKATVLYDRLPAIEKQPPYQVNDHSKIQLLYLANYNVGKGQNKAIEAIKLLSDQFDNLSIQLTFVGGDFNLNKNKVYKQSLIALSKHYGIDRYMTFQDKSSDVEVLMKKNDIVLNLSDSESFSRLSLEALFYGIPLIATDVGGTREMFENNSSGILVQKDDIESIANAIMKLVTSFDQRKLLSDNSRKYVREKFNNHQTSEKLKKIYNGL